MSIKPVGVPTDWDDDHLLMFEDFCKHFDIPPRTAYDWRQRKIGPRWYRFNGTGRLYTTVAEIRRWLARSQ